MPSCLRLFWHLARFADSRAACTAGMISATRTPMIAITTSSSMRVNPADGRLTLLVRTMFKPLGLGANSESHLDRHFQDTPFNDLMPSLSQRFLTTVGCWPGTASEPAHFSSTDQ